MASREVGAAHTAGCIRGIGLEIHSATSDVPARPGQDDAANRGYRVYCNCLKRLAEDILRAKAKNNLDALFKKILSARLWIFDDWGVTTMSREVAEEVFDLLDRRKHSSAMIMTSNRDVDEWPQVFPDPVIANATIDRIFDRADISVFKGTSYRLKGKIEIKNVDVKIRKN